MRHTTQGLRRAAVFAGSAALAASVLVACGGDDSDGGNDDSDGGDSSSSEFTDLEPQEILDAAEEATKGASSVHVSGTAEEDGQETELDLTLGEDGCEGTISLGGAEVEVLGADGQNWFRASDEFWEEQAGEDAAVLLPLVSGKWIVDSEGDFDDFCSIETFFEGDGDSEEKEDLEKGDVEDVDGTEAIELTYVEDGSDVSAWIAVDEPNYLLRIVNDDAGEFTLSDFDEDVSFEAPDSADVVDLNDLG